MAEDSRFWDGTTLGDATDAPYNGFTEFSIVMMATSGALQYTNKAGVFGLNSEGTLTVTGASSPLSMAAGQSQVYGTWYHNDAALSIPVVAPLGATRKDLLVIRKSWASQTCRATLIAGVEGGVVASPVQVAGTTWDEPIFEVDITTGGVITLIDRREYLPPAVVPPTPPIAQRELVNQQFFQTGQTVVVTSVAGTYVDFAAGFSIAVACNAGDRVIIKGQASIGSRATPNTITAVGLALDKDSGTKLLTSANAPVSYLDTGVGTSGNVDIVTGASFEYIDDAVAAGTHTYKLQGVVMVNAAGNNCYFGNGSIVQLIVEVWRAP